jgi:hypothetical protein
MTTTKPLTGPLIQSCSRITPRGVEFVKEKMETFNVNTFAILVDHTTQPQDLQGIPTFNFVGFYTFDIYIAGKSLFNQEIKIVGQDGPVPKCDGWLIASTSRAAAISLNQTLLQTGNQHQILIRFYGGQTTETTGYMDLVSGDAETLVYLQHYFDRKYRIITPMDIRYTVRACDGTIAQSGQRILPPGGLTVFDTREMNLGNFKGYIRIDLEIENLQVRVQPFLHYWADYISDAGLCRNHQSGWAPWPPDTVFNRGYLPIDPNYEALGCFYNDNDTEINMKALLHFNQDGNEKSVERKLDPVPAKQMSYQNYSKIFSDVSLEGVHSAFILVSGNKEIHRPNHYIAKKDSMQFVDTYHQTGGMACYWSSPSYNLNAQALKLFSDYGFEPWLLQLPILAPRFNIETFLGLHSMTICAMNDFTALVRNEQGEVLHSEELSIDGTFPQFLNLNHWIRERNLNISEGTFCLKPSQKLDQLTHNNGCFFGLKHVDFPTISTSFINGTLEANLPFYVTAGFPRSREYTYSPHQTTDLFSPGIFNDEYDSIFIVKNYSLLKEYNKKVSYQIEIFDSQGNLYVAHRTVDPKMHDAFWLSELLTQANATLPDPYCTVWIKSKNTMLKSYHGLYRKQDHALSFDDASEGTLQKDPQIGSLDHQKFANVFIQFINETGIGNMIPNASTRQQLLQQLLRKMMDLV